MPNYDNFPPDITKLRTAKELKGRVKELFSDLELIEMAKNHSLPHYVLINPVTKIETFLFDTKELLEWVNKNWLTKNQCFVSQHLHFVCFDYEKYRINNYDGVPNELAFIKELYILPSTVSSTPPGIYFLCNGKEIVYIGQSRNVGNRIPNHRGKEYDRVFFIPCHVNQLCDFERALIRRFKPPLNSSGACLDAKDKKVLELILNEVVPISGQPVEKIERESKSITLYA